MPMAFKVRTSKYRHVYGSPFRKEKTYENLRITRNAHDSSFCSVNQKSLAVVTESCGGGSFVVLPLERTGRVDFNVPKVSGHSGAVLDIKWNPFNDDIIASASEDCSVKLWQIPKEGLTAPLTDWWVDLHGHTRRVGYIEWHPSAENIILSTGFDFKCIVWNVEQAEPVNIVDCHKDTVFSVSWNREGSLFATTSKDKVLRAIDPRTCDVAVKTPCHAGPKASKVAFVENSKMITTGFSKYHSRELCLWDMRQPEKAISTVAMDNSCGVIMPYFDYDTNVVFLAGKGDGNICYYEVTDGATGFFYLNNFQSSFPQRGLGVMPKRGCDVSRCEIVRFYKLHASKNMVEPISMIVPRKSDTFQEDIFPPTASSVPSLHADEWISGQNREPILVSLKDGLVTNTPKITTSKAVQKQDNALQQAPTITTYKAVDGRMGEQSVQMRHKGLNSAAEPSSSHSNRESGSQPASVKNIKRLSLNEDIVSVPGASSPSPSKVVEKKVYSPVNSPGAEHSTNGLPSSVDSEHEFSRFNHGSALWRANSATWAEVPSCSSANSGSENSAASSKRRDRVARSKTISSPYEHSSHISMVIAEPSVQAHGNKIHIRKTWHSQQPNLQPLSENEALATPSTDSELKKAYFRQLEEIRSLKEQVLLKDKRIRQLESELSSIKEQESSLGPGESNC